MVPEVCHGSGLESWPQVRFTERSYQVSVQVTCFLQDFSLANTVILVLALNYFIYALSLQYY